MRITCLSDELLQECKKSSSSWRRDKWEPELKSEEDFNKLLAEVLKTRGGTVIHKKDVIAPCVYIFCAEDHQVLYVGFSTLGFKRVFGFNQATSMPNREAAWEIHTEYVIVIPCEAERDARDLEWYLIKSCDPPFNRRK